jgi:peptidoglycan/LPS O-acetylase OafA/YrhL
MTLLRQDIQGLRGIAVLAVVIHHAFERALPGGFIGVDIFFVISGYVITLSLLTASARRQLSIREFYVRRIRRIVPALLLVLGASWAAGWLLLTPQEFSRLGAHVAASALFSNNILLWTEAGYFDARSSSKPLLHLWSLGIEEQFYIVLPLLLWFLRNSLVRFALTVGTLTAASFGAWLFFLQTAPEGVFYLLPFRWWELAAGVLLACAHQGVDRCATRPAPTRRSILREQATSVAALLGLGGSCFLIDRDVWPSALAILPITFTLLLLHVHRAGATALHGWRPLAYVGGISFTLYLWHWPVLVFWQRSAFLNELAGPWLPLGLAVCLAVATTHLVEHPIRFGRLARRAIVPAGLIGGLFVALAAGVLTKVERGFPDRLPEAARLFDPDLAADTIAAWRVNRCFGYTPMSTEIPPECAPRAPGSVWLWGDSHAAHLYPGLLTSPALGKVEVGQLTTASCPPTMEAMLGEGPGCEIARSLALKALAGPRPPKVVVLSAHWLHYARGAGATPDAIGAAIVASARHIRKLGVERVVVVGPAPYWESDLAGLLLAEAKRNNVRHIPVRFGGNPEALLELDRRLAKSMASAELPYFSVLNALCSDPAGCMVRHERADASELFFFDGSHLSAAGALFVANLLALEISR